MEQFAPSEPVWLTRATTFREKAVLFPRSTFVVGADTIARIANPHYYKNEQDCLDAIRLIASQGCRFLVFGRMEQDRFQTLSDLYLPESLLQICDEVLERHFRQDISSTAIRTADEPNEP